MEIKLRYNFFLYGGGGGVLGRNNFLLGYFNQKGKFLAL